MTIQMGKVRNVLQNLCTTIPAINGMTNRTNGYLVQVFIVCYKNTNW